MTDQFPAFARLVADRFELLTHNTPFVVGIHPDNLWATYIMSFPPGTDPLFKTRSEHDCSCCKSFIRHVAGVVAVDDGRVLTIWDDAAESAPYPYNVVAAALRDFVRSAKIVDIFRVHESEASFGKFVTLSKEGERVVEWNHFETKVIIKDVRVRQPDAVRGAFRTDADVFERGLKELSPEAIDETIKLIAEGLYRGAEFKPKVLAFQQAQRTYNAMEPAAKNVFVMTTAANPATKWLTHFKSEAIGELVKKLTDGLATLPTLNRERLKREVVADAADLFEKMVDPENYMRTTAAVSPRQINNAFTLIDELGLRPSLERRHARIDDISINDVKWAANETRSQMKDALKDALLAHAAATSKATEVDDKNVTPIHIDDFMKTVLPKAEAMELLFKGEHIPHLASLTAPVHADVKQLFAWGNDFALVYNGNIADSAIKQRVKQAGGKTDAALRISLSWHNYDDLDIHVFEPGFKNVPNSTRTRPGSDHLNGHHIFYAHKRGRGGGVLDVDMNSPSSVHTRDAVENVVWSAPADGPYVVVVNNYTLRENTGTGFTIEVENNGKLSHYTCGKNPPNGGDIHVVTLFVKDGVIIKVDVGGPVETKAMPQTTWGLTTERFAKVRAVSLSPNFWEGASRIANSEPDDVDVGIGNKHTVFYLEGALNDQPARGILNEYLHPRLKPHRRVFELLGEKTLCPPTPDQLSGLGFSSTKKASAVLKVTSAKKQRLFNVHFGA